MHDELDLNLFRFFHVLYTVRSVTQAAHQLGITQPAASQRLMRLRHILHDPLFTRIPGGVRPTPVADRLAPHVARALQEITTGLTEHRQFEPATVQRCYRFHMSDTGEARFLPQLVQGLWQQAPGVRIECAAHDTADVANLLHDGAIDFALGYLPGLEGIESRALLQDTYVLVSRPGLVLPASAPLPPDALHPLSFVSARSHTHPNQLLSSLGLDARVMQRTSGTLALLRLVQSTDLCAVLARSIAAGLADTMPLAIHELDLPQETFLVSLYWSHRFAHLAYHRWMKEYVMATVR